MPIKIPADLPAHDVLRREGVVVMSEETARRQDIRPLQIALLNLMPKKVQTETQFARLTCPALAIYTFACGFPRPQRWQHAAAIDG